MKQRGPLGNSLLGATHCPPGASGKSGQSCHWLNRCHQAVYQRPDSVVKGTFLFSTSASLIVRGFAE